jgi:hypothetical protein
MDTFDEDFFINCSNGHMGACANCLSFMVTDNCPLCRENLFPDDTTSYNSDTDDSDIDLDDSYFDDLPDAYLNPRPINDAWRREILNSDDFYRVHSVGYIAEDASDFDFSDDDLDVSEPPTIL